MCDLVYKVVRDSGRPKTFYTFKSLAFTESFDKVLRQRPMPNVRIVRKENIKWEEEGRWKATLTRGGNDGKLCRGYEQASP